MNQMTQMRMTDFSSTLDSQGFAILENLCPSAVLDEFLKISKEQVEKTLKDIEGKEIGIGSAAGFEEVVQRSENRWDIPIDFEEFGYDFKEMPWWPLVQSVLGEDAELFYSGVVTSKPGCPAQEWHMDSPHTSKEHRPAHVVNVLIALEDITERMGPTELAKGSHVLTNHLKNPELKVDELVYQCDRTSPKRLIQSPGQNEPDTFHSAMMAGTCLFFDDRILHRGRANQSLKDRHVAYFSYKKSDFSEDTYFESQRSLYSN